MAEETVEKIYQKKTLLEQILLRPDTYIGSVESFQQFLWVFDQQANNIMYKKIEYVPGLFKIFDEILVNASDNYQRDHSMTTVKVEIDKASNKISIWNNGKGIPCVIHKEHGVFVPELIFGHLLTSSNYDDTKKKVTGGRNGYGAKLTNIFSKKFIVEASDSRQGKKFYQEYTDNMSNKTEPKISTYTGNEDYTCITFYPDLARFGMTELEDDIISLMVKRVYDIAGITPDSVKVFLNGKRVQINSFSQYVDLYLRQSKKFKKNEETKTIENGEPGEEAEKPEELPKIYEKVNDRWEVCASLSDGQFQQVSFVNGICTVKGGTHVNYVSDQIVEAITEVIKKKHKLELKPHQVKSQLWVFVNSMIENPTFDSQTKETLTLKPTSFGSECKLSDKFLTKVLTSGIVEMLVAITQAKEKAALARQLSGKKMGRLIGIEKLEDANWAGTKKSHECILIVTEGDSAKGLAMKGIEVLGRDRYGVFPLRGKMLNVRDAGNKQIMANKEISSLVKILGLRVGQVYEDVKPLRYGGLMIMADQDVDGSHIKGLVINFIQAFWPSLFRMDSFLMQFITPIIKATKGKDMKQFFTMPEYEEWAENSHLKGYKIKYYKGLGTSTLIEAKEYFQNLEIHKLDFTYENDEDDEAIAMAFGKKNANLRKTWLNTYEEGMHIDYGQGDIRYKDFVNKELILFSRYDNMRSIPSVCDGFKPGQRKIMFACFKRNLKYELKVAQLSGYVAEHSSYHHGEQSLASTIVGMAQNFVGSNNINLLMPNGQFGTRHMGGKEAASARYIYTCLSKLARAIFRPEDDPLMHYQIEEGQKIEPDYYLPIIPMILVNGAAGIGTGWSTIIPNYNPRDIVENLRRKLKNEPFVHMDPWFKNFKGRIVPNTTADKKSKDVNGYKCYGTYKVQGENALIIDELPIRKWTAEYKNFLQDLILDEMKLDGRMPKEEKKGKGKGKGKAKKGKADKSKGKKANNQGVALGEKRKKRKKKAEDETNSESDVSSDHGSQNSSPEGSPKKKKRRSKEHSSVYLGIEDLREYHVGNDIHFELQMKKESLAALAQQEEGIIKAFHLSTNICMTQLVCFDSDGKLRRYNNELEIMEEFFPLRLAFYGKRKAHMIAQLKRELGIIDNKVRFILGVIAEEIKLKKVKRKDVVKTLFDMKFALYSSFQDKNKDDIFLVQERNNNENPDNPENNDENNNESNDENNDEKSAKSKKVKSSKNKKESESDFVVPTKEYEYLLTMPLLSLTFEKVEDLLEKKKEKEDSLDRISKTSERQMWETDLDEFLIILDEVEKKEQEEIVKELEEARKSGDHAKKARKPRKKKVDDSDKTSLKSAKTTKSRKGKGTKEKVTKGKENEAPKINTLDTLMKQAEKKEEKKNLWEIPLSERLEIESKSNNVIENQPQNEPVNYEYADIVKQTAEKRTKKVRIESETSDNDEIVSLAETSKESGNNNGGFINAYEDDDSYEASEESQEVSDVSDEN